MPASWFSAQTSMANTATSSQPKSCQQLQLQKQTKASPVWQHFGLPVQHNANGTWVMDWTKNVCQQCFTEVWYAPGNTSNMLTRHPDMSIAQRLFPAALKQPLHMKTYTAKNITKAIIHIYCISYTMNRMNEWYDNPPNAFYFYSLSFITGDDF